MKRRITGFDYLRCLCAIVVVGHHSLDTNAITSRFASAHLRFVVPVFLMMSFLLLLNKSNINETSYLACFYQRFKRTAPQFLIWSFIYILIRRFSGNSSIVLSASSFVEYFLLGGAAMQLYYIPMLLCFTAILLPLIMLIRAKLWRKSLFITILLSLSSILLIVIDLTQALPSPYKLFLHYFAYNFPCVLIAVCLGTIIRSSLKSGSYRFIVLAHASIFLTVVFCLPFLVFGDSQQLFYFYRMTLLDITLWLVFYYLPLPVNTWITQLSQISFGIYFCHPIFVEGIQRIETKIGLDLSSLWLTIANFILGCLISIGLCTLLNRYQKTRFLVT